MPKEALKEEVENDEDESISVEVEDDSTEEAQETESEEKEEPKAKSEEDELEQYSDGVKKRISKLTAKMREAERREQAALEYAQAVKKQLEESNQQRTSLDASYVTEFENRVNTEEQLLKQELKRAYDRGDTDAQFEVQKRLAALASQQERLQYVKQEQERRKTQPQQQVQVPQAQQPKATKPDAKAEAWAERNEWFGADEPMTLTALYLHKQLTEQEGYDPTSDEYYAEVDRRMRSEFPHKFKIAEQKPKAKSGPQVASANRGGTRGGKQQVKLTPSQVAISKKLGITEQQYAKQLLRMQQTS